MSKIGYLDSLIDEWARDVVDDYHKDGFYSINVVERLLHAPGSPIPGHRVLWWPRNRRLAKTSKAMNQISPLDQMILAVNAGCVRNEDNTTFTIQDLKKNSSLTIGDIRERVRLARGRLRELLI